MRAIIWQIFPYLVLGFEDIVDGIKAKKWFIKL
jgi:hypothetical protein